MRIINPSVSIMNPPDYQQMLKHIEAAGRTCYKSEDKYVPGTTAEPFTRRIIESGHGSVLEHISLTVRFICDRGVSHELVRHRLCSFSQESTRYCNYSGEKFGREVTFIRPMFWEKDTPHFGLWRDAMQQAENYYLHINHATSPQEARSVLPNSLKTEIVVTANIREWRLIFSQRCAKDAHPEMRRCMLPLLEYCLNNYNVFFADLGSLYSEGCAYFFAKNWQLAEVGVE